MKLSRNEVQAWLDVVAPGVGLTTLSQQVGLPRLRLFQQMHSGNVPPSTVVHISRSLGLDPFNELRHFQMFSAVQPELPLIREIPAFIPTSALLRACAERLDDHWISESWTEDISEHTALFWFEIADDGDLRESLRANMKISQPTLWKMLRTRLREDVAMYVARYAGFPISTALVVSGLLSAEEAGWPKEYIGDWMQEIPLNELLSIAERRLHDVGKLERSRQAFDDHLG